MKEMLESVELRVESYSMGRRSRWVDGPGLPPHLDEASS